MFYLYIKLILNESKVSFVTMSSQRHKLFILIAFLFVSKVLTQTLEVYQENRENEEVFRKSAQEMIKYEDFNDIEEDEYDEEHEKDKSDEFDDAVGGTGLRNKTRHWPKIGSFVEVPYKIDTKSRFTTKQKANILKAMQQIQKETCIKFVQHTRQANFIKFKSPNGK